LNGKGRGKIERIREAGPEGLGIKGLNERYAERRTGYGSGHRG